MSIIRDQLTEMVNPSRLGIHEDRGAKIFASSESWADPLAWAGYMRRILGERAALRGFWSFENPKATKLLSVSDIHAFAVVDDRYIVDGWAAHVMAICAQPVTDLQDRAALLQLRDVYGDTDKWQRIDWLEAIVDDESKLHRSRLLKGVNGIEQSPAPSL